MYGNKVENPGDTSQTLHEFQAFQEELLHQNQQHHYNIGGIARSQASSVLPRLNIPPAYAINSVQLAPNLPIRDLSLCVPPPSNYTGIYNPMTAASLQFSADEGSSSNHLGLAGLHGCSAGLVQAGSAAFCLQTELGNMTTQEMMDAKALSASKSHSEAERRRRERINKHLARLRSLLPSTTKTDKASLLAEVIQHVKDLKRQTSEMAEESPIPTEVDELTVDATDKDGNFVFKASLCCDDRSDLLPDIIKTLKALRLRMLKAEITTLGGRVKNVLLIAGEEDSNNRKQSISSIQKALKAVMERTDSGGTSSTVLKRQRTNISMI